VKLELSAARTATPAGVGFDEHNVFGISDKAITITLLLIPLIRSAWCLEH
jgi:hypothetical protein